MRSPREAPVRRAPVTNWCPIGDKLVLGCARAHAQSGYDGLGAPLGIRRERAEIPGGTSS
eukprot:9614307-Heterocapsa_arctica.AAC.1